ncbi:hypothetical protein BGW80DRAFT_309032 [Lactifluus volemus]|nr:hypothetical protein BGW80DRAFT_309032 [Lactifluus volemus]
MSSINSPAAEYAYMAYLTTMFRISGIAIQYYDYVLTLSREIQFLWPPHNKQGWYTMACLLNRYLPLFGHLSFFITFLVPGDISVCQGLHVFHQGFMILSQALACALCLVRVYALFDRSRIVLGFLMGIILGAVINACLLMAAIHGDRFILIYGFYGCNQMTSTPGGLYAALAWTGVLIFDLAIFSLTLYKAFEIGRGGRLWNVIVRDGTMYFLVLSIMNLGNILMLRFSPPLLKTSTSILTNVISNTLVSRLVLNLREQHAAIAGEPVLVETEWRFQSAEPTAEPITFLSSDQVDKSMS